LRKLAHTFVVDVVGYGADRLTLRILGPMNRRSHRMRVDLDARGLKVIPDDELHAVLRGVDDIIGRGGRSLLTKILRGSRSKPVLDHGLDGSPVHGYFSKLSNDDTHARIDWTILNGYLRLEYGDRLPLLVFTDKGWEIAREIRANELLEGIQEEAHKGPPYHMEHLKDRDRGMILMLLDKIEATGDNKLVPALRAWKKIDYKKVQIRINQVIQQLKDIKER
jgi:RQC domain